MKCTMIPIRDGITDFSSRSSSQSTTAWFYLSLELIISIGISIAVTLLRFIKTLLPAPPRNLKGDVVLVAGVKSQLGRSLAEEFAKGGCYVICVDADLKSAETIASRLSAKYPAVQNIGYLKDDRAALLGSSTRAYECDLYDRADIQTVAQRVKDEVGRVDVLVTCAGQAHYDIFDTVSKTLMSHYWTIMSFLPTMMLSGRANVIGVIPSVSANDAYAGSKAAIAGLIESLSETFSNQARHLKFIAVTPKLNDTEESDQQTAKDVIEAIKMDQNSLKVTYISRITYRISCAIYEGLNFITQYIDA